MTATNTYHTTAANAEDAPSIQDRLIDMIQSDPEMPTLGSSIQKVAELTTSGDESLEKLTNVILTDPSLTLEVLRLANSIAYRATSQTVTSISNAIQLLGLDAVKACALALILVDGMPRRHADAVRGELIIALSASLFGRNLAKLSRFPNAEEVAVVALLKNMGRLILAAFDDQLYRETMALASEKGYTESKASLEKLGCSFDWITEFALKSWHIPDSIIQAMKLFSSGTLKSPKSRSEWMQQAAEFSKSAAPMMLRPESSQTSATGKTLLNRFGGALNLNEAKLRAIVSESAKQLRMVSSLTDEKLQQNGYETDQPNTIGDAAADVTDVTAAATTAGNTDARTNQTQTVHHSGKPPDAMDRLLDGVQEISDLIASRHFNVNSLLMLVLETLYRGMGFRFVTICVRDVRNAQFRARNSVGANQLEIQRGFVFPDDCASDLFSMALSRSVDLVISDATAPKIRNALPEWHKRLLPDTKSLMILPLMLRDKPVGLIYADRAEVASEAITASEMKLIRALKANVLVAFNP